MKVLYLLNTTVMCGANISFINLIKGLHKNGIECYIVYPDEVLDKDFKKRINPYVKGFYHVNLKSYFHDSNNKHIKKIVRDSFLYQLFKHYSEDKEMNKIIEEVQPDIIHTNVGVIQAGYRASKKFNLPHVWHLREYQTKDFSWEIEPSKSKLIKMLKDSYVVTITNGILTYFDLQNYDKAEVIYNGCFSKNDTALLMPKEKYFLCSSRISPEKGYDDVIRAYAKFCRKYPNYKLLLAGFGDPKYIIRLKMIAKREKCLDGLEFLGFRNDVRTLMDKATALIVASKFEGFGRMTAEAAFRGCLVIGHNTGGTREILQQTGGIAYKNGADDLEKAMEEVISYDNEKYEEITKKAQQVAVERFSNEQCVDKMMNLYNKILSNR